MIDFLSLLKDTNVYNAIKNDRKKDVLSHAYLFITKDSLFMREYIKIFAKLIQCKEEDPCEKCRTCKLIQEEGFLDTIIYPKDGEAIKTEDISSLIEESFIKPIESDKKVFILCNVENMNTIAQNKLLKTLEEPPKNVYLLLGATNEFSLLPTIKSRVKKFELADFPNEKIEKAIKEECEDKERLITAISAGDGTVGTALSLYKDENLISTMEIVEDTIINLQKSAEILEFSAKISGLKGGIKEFLKFLLLAYRDLLLFYENKEKLIFNKELFNKIKNAKGYNTYAVIWAIDKIEEAQKKLSFNTNETMVLEWLLFQILEGKYKCQK